MSEYVILFRNLHNNLVGFISNESGDEISVFPDVKSAEDLARTHILLKRHYPYQIVELEI